MRAIPLDIFRIFLCLLVIDYHYGKLFSAGALAVVGFFVLSGYFLESEFERSATLNIQQFYQKKAIRLLPEYLFISIPALIVTGFFPEFYSVDFHRAETSPFTLMGLLESANNPSWFLTCLFAFILLAPVFFCLHRTRWGILLAFVLAFAYRLALFHYTRGRGVSLYMAAETNIVFFLGGMLARQLSQRVAPGRLLRGILMALSTAGLLSIILLKKQGTWTTASCFLFMLLIPMLHIPSPGPRWYQLPIIWLSSLSYAMYLFHAPVRRTGIIILTRLSEYTEQEILTPAFYCVSLLLTIAAAALFQFVKARVFKTC